jgi:hypothetical protein
MGGPGSGPRKGMSNLQAIRNITRKPLRLKEAKPIRSHEKTKKTSIRIKSRGKVRRG